MMEKVRYVYFYYVIFVLLYRPPSKDLLISIQLIGGISPPYWFTKLLFVHIHPSLVSNVEPMIDKHKYDIGHTK